MKISYNWLKDYVDITERPHELADMLTMAGLEVESVDRIRHVPDGVVVGRVLSVDGHPKADRLTVCSVDTGSGDPLQIICGAPNVAVGQLVPVATVGTHLSMADDSAPAGVSEITVGARPIRGVESHGMICAEDEIGLSDDHSGIMVLDEDAEVGTPLRDYLSARGRSEDYVIDVAITPNRPDATSHVGVARDVAALTNRPLRLPEVPTPSGPGEAAKHVTVTIDSPELCHRYVGVVVRGVRIQESPRWLKTRLEAVGLRPRNNVVDITNYVMYEIGQPLHAFDLDELTSAEIVVRATERTSTFVTLDDKERTLPAGSLMIRDGTRDVAIAGVMGGQNSEVSDKTVNVLIESAYFDPSSVRKTAKATGLQTDASYRFERGVDPEVQAWAALRAAHLMAELAEGTVVEGLVDAHPIQHTRRTVEVRLTRADHLLGAHVPRQEAIRQLEAIGMVVDAGDGDRITCTIPPYRPDIEREVDVIEEVARLYGYDRIEEPPRLRVPSFIPRPTQEETAHRTLFSRLTGWGFREAFTNSLLSEEVAGRFYDPGVAGDLYGGDVVTTANAITQDMTTLRPSLLPGLLQVARHNVNHGQSEIRLVEMGHVFSRQERADSIIPGYEEHEALTLLLTGVDGDRHWSEEPRAFDFHDIVGFVDAVLELFAVPAVRREPLDSVEGIVDVGVAYYSGDSRLGLAGQLEEAVANEYDLDAPVLFAEMNWSRLLSAAPSDQHQAFVPISRFPTVERDLAFLVPASQPAGALLELIRSEGGPLLRESGLFDVYKGDRVEAGRKSLAFFLRFGADRTLTDQEVDERIAHIVGTVTRTFDADLRE